MVDDVHDAFGERLEYVIRWLDLIRSNDVAEGCFAVIQWTECENAFRKELAVCCVYWRIFISHQILHCKAILLSCPQQLIQHIRLSCSWRFFPVVTSSSFGTMWKLCHLSTVVIMKSSRGIIRIVASSNKTHRMLLSTPWYHLYIWRLVVPDHLTTSLGHSHEPPASSIFYDIVQGNTLGNQAHHSVIHIEHEDVHSLEM